MLRIQSAEPPLELDACRSCGVVWFDPLEFEAIPEGAIESPTEARMRGAEAFALAKIERMREQQDSVDEPDEEWKTIPGLFGFPVETQTNPLQRWPLVTWSISVLIILTSAWSFWHLDEVVARFGLIPAEAFRLGGLTWFTSFLLHGGILHLLGNLYFLLIFGDNVEDYLGRWKFCLLILLADMAGNLVHVLATPHSIVPCIGASGGISGIIVFYALQFPKARLSFMIGPGYLGFSRWGLGWGWLNIPAWGALILWLLLQTFTLMTEMVGLSNVAATSHFGGAAAGLVAWLVWRSRQKRPILDV